MPKDSLEHVRGELDDSARELSTSLHALGGGAPLDVGGGVSVQLVKPASEAAVAALASVDNLWEPLAAQIAKLDPNAPSARAVAGAAVDAQEDIPEFSTRAERVLAEMRTAQAGELEALSGQRTLFAWLSGFGALLIVAGLATAILWTRQRFAQQEAALDDSIRNERDTTRWIEAIMETSDEGLMRLDRGLQIQPVHSGSN